jgi:hypothetical protein
MKAKKEARDDAISSTKAAVVEGIVPGGGLALVRCIEAVAAKRRLAEATSGPASKFCNGHSKRRRVRSRRTQPSTAVSSLRG